MTNHCRYYAFRSAFDVEIIHKPFNKGVCLIDGMSQSVDLNRLKVEIVVIPNDII